MWSKHQPAETSSNKNNMTSLKDKITHRKRKGNKSKNVQTSTSTATVDANNINSANNNTKSAKKVNKQQNNLRNNSKSSSGNAVDKNSVTNTGSGCQKSENPTVQETVAAEHLGRRNAPKEANGSLVYATALSNKDDVTGLSRITDDSVIRGISPALHASIDQPDVSFRNDTLLTRLLCEPANGTTGSVKRYSDSFIIERNSGGGRGDRVDSNLSRARSGFFLNEIDEGIGDEFAKQPHASGRKSRRFSDIFKYGALRHSDSCDNLKLSDRMVVQDDVNGGTTEVQLRKPSKADDMEEKSKKNAKKVTRTDSTRSANAGGAGGKAKGKPSSVKVTKTTEKTDNTPGNNSINNNSSYLKRVKSKIYRPKSENNCGVSALPTMPEISENAKSKKNKNKKQPQSSAADSKAKENEAPSMRNSVSYFDFRLIRQTSNLESIRPGLLGHKKSVSNVGVGGVDCVDGALEKPVLAKSKSSSAINLNLLRTRRNKLMEQIRKNNKSVQDEFDFISFSGVPYPGSVLSRKFGSQNLPTNAVDVNTAGNNTPARPSSWLHGNAAGDTKPGHPVTRSGSDRRPDALREEPSRTQDTHNHTQDNEDDVTASESSKSLPATTTNKRKNNSNINRSESVKEQTEKRKQRRNISDPLHNTSDSVDIDNNQALGYQANYGSTSNSSLSSGSSNDSPSSSVDNTFTIVPPSAGSSWDNENDYIEADPPDWQSSLSEEELARLQPHEKKRQDVINELFHTERTHLRNLKVLERVFCKRIQEQKLLKDDEISLLFPNLSDLISIHSKFNTLMMSKKKDVILVREVGDILMTVFDGPMGESFQKAAATFCEKQQHALDFIKEKRRKDSKFETYLTEFEKDPACRRLPLQGFIPSEMQRLSKYPLLLERLIDVVEKNAEADVAEYSQTELSNLQQAHNRSKEILNYVNEAAKQAWSKFRLQEIQKHLDTSVFEKTEHAIVNEFKNLDLTKYNLIYEGTVQLKRQNKGLLNVHMVLLEEVVILLQREGERFLLKFFQSGIPGQQPLAPIIKMSTLLVRTNAALKCSLFLVNTSTQHSQMHELLTRDNTERKTWFKHLSDAAEAYNKREGKSKRTEPTPDEEETVVELPSTREPTTERAESIGGSESAASETEQSVPSTDSNQRTSSATEDDKDKRLSHSDSETSEAATVVGGSSTGGGGVSMKFAADDWPLIQPYEVQAEIPPVHSAAPVLTPIEQIRRKGEVVRQALEDKEKLVADLLSIPREDYHHIADMAIEEAKNKELTEREPAALVLASVYQVDQLLLAVNQSLDVSESDPVLTTGGKHPSCASNENLVSKNNVPSVPVHRLQEIATTLNSQLTTLLSVIKQREEERDRLRRELQRTREQLHEKLALHCSSHYSDDETQQIDLIQSGDLESIEESPTENEST